MDIKIGIQNIGRELSIDTDASADEIQQQIGEALSGNGVLTLSDAKGRRLIVPAQAIGYVDLGQEHTRPVGFGAL